MKTVVLFFEKGKPTKKVWYYQLNVGRNMGKTNPLNERDLEDFIQSAANQVETDNSWLVDVADIDTDTWDLTVNNPNRVERTTEHHKKSSLRLKNLMRKLLKHCKQSRSCCDVEDSEAW